MKVRELIEILQTIDPDGEVSIVNDGSKTEEENLVSYDITNWWTDDNDRNYIDLAISDEAFVDCIETIEYYQSQK